MQECCTYHGGRLQTFLAAEVPSDKMLELFLGRYLKELLPHVNKAKAKGVTDAIKLASQLGSSNLDADIMGGTIARRLSSQISNHMRSESLKKQIDGSVKRMYGDFRHATPGREIFPEETLRQYPALKDWTLPLAPNLALPDQRTRQFLAETDYHYLGRYITEEDSIKRLKEGITRIYIDEGAAIGRSPSSIARLKSEFTELADMEDWKVRRIVDTSVNSTRNAAHLRSLQQVGAESYEIAGANDNLICPYCANMVGRTFVVQKSIDKLDMQIVAGSAALPETRPFLSSQVRVDDLKNMSNDTIQSSFSEWPPYHPHCRHRVIISAIPIEQVEEANKDAEKREKKTKPKPSPKPSEEKQPASKSDQQKSKLFGEDAHKRFSSPGFKEKIMNGDITGTKAVMSQKLDESRKDFLDVMNLAASDPSLQKRFGKVFEEFRGLSANMTEKDDVFATLGRAAFKVFGGDNKETAQFYSAFFDFAAQSHSASGIKNLTDMLDRALISGEGVSRLKKNLTPKSMGHMRWLHHTVWDELNVKIKPNRLRIKSTGSFDAIARTQTNTDVMWLDYNSKYLAKHSASDIANNVTHEIIHHLGGGRVYGLDVVSTYAFRMKPTTAKPWTTYAHRGYKGYSKPGTKGGYHLFGTTEYPEMFTTSSEIMSTIHSLSEGLLVNSYTKNLFHSMLRDDYSMNLVWSMIRGVFYDTL